MRFPSAIALIYLTAVEAVQYGFNAVTVRRDPAAVEAQFPNVGVDLLSPYFRNPQGRLPGFNNGTQGPTSLADMQAYMQSVSSRRDYMTYNTKAFTSEELRPFPYVRLSLPYTRRTSRSSSGKVRIWVQGAAHGNEPAGDESLLALLGKFDAEPDWARNILDKTDIVVMPRYNPDGVYYFQRTLASNYDPNRDHVKLARQQTRAIKRQLSGFDPHVIIDMHEFGASTQYGPYNHASDGLFSAAKNLNIHPGIRNISEALFARRIGEAMERAGLRWEPYVTGPSSTNQSFIPRWDEAGTDAKIGRNAMGLTQAVTFLIEMRGIGIADQEFQRRTAAGLTMAQSIIETAAYSSAEVAAAVEGGRRAFISSNDPVVITDYSTNGYRPFKMIETATGQITSVNVSFASTTPATANLTRPRPEAYLIPVAWADLAERLRVSGLQVDTLSEPFVGTVETLLINSTRFGTEYYEGAVLVTARTTTRTRQVRLPAGSFRVSTRQKNAALAFVALEPENIDSYVSFNIVPVDPGDEYPVYRQMA